MDEDLACFREQVRRFVYAELAPNLDGYRDQGFIPRDKWASLGRLGALLPEIDEKYGGSGASIAYQMVLQDELARAEVPACTAVHSIAAHYIVDYGTSEQKVAWLPRLSSGELFAGIALTESSCGSDLKALRTKAVRESDDYVINGSKMFITNAHSGNFLVVAVRTGEEGSRGVSLICVETEGLKGFSVGRRLKKIGMHASDTCELFFDNVRVPASNLLGNMEGSGFVQLMSQLPYERMLLAASAAAIMERAVEITIEYTKQRRAFGKPLAELQNTRFKVAECATIAHVARTYVDACIQRLIDGDLDAESAYMAKWWCTDQQCKVVDECLQLFGGYGYMAEYPIARMYADSRIQKIYGGANEVMKDLIGRKLFS